ncbi:predicted protein [Chaetomium globosum CBS 148.51]|uniref:Uncharacterized protein n=1 Tax=Chaetomium globosum (strain ATCC 6205 / CBS 148.51 / DSM 1962 / NBRC 6347 / NRRL 1970) TaxID=306901 RepID=Q2HAZ8_CHAGB|nr:uncharacterized protein CHGG_02606 [Chaetomium globosum CBS 148.51]EAQ90671.1 predicted protein [Chaetomium globosum CBS 148.51]
MHAHTSKPDQSPRGLSDQHAQWLKPPSLGQPLMPRKLQVTLLLARSVTARPCSQPARASQPAPARRTLWGDKERQADCHSGVYPLQAHRHP